MRPARSTPVRTCRGAPPYAGVMDESDAGDAPVRAADHPLASAKYVALTTFRRSGAAVTTPVWFAPSLDEPGLFAVITVDDTGKTKRLAHTDAVELQACDVRGKVATGAPVFHGTARIVRDAAGVASVRRAVVAKYGLPARFSDLTDMVGARVRPEAGAAGRHPRVRRARRPCEPRTGPAAGG